jgi:hypothetical protein
MDMLNEQYRGFSISCPRKRILGTVFPVFAEVRNRVDHPELEHLLRKASGDLVEGVSPLQAIENARRYVDGLFELTK